MPWLITVIVVLLIIVFFLLGRGRKIIYIDPSAEQIAKAEKEYQIKKEALERHLAEERKIAIQEIKTEMTEVKTNWENEIKEQREKAFEHLNEIIKFEQEKIEHKKVELNKHLEETKLQTTEQVEVFKTLLQDWKSRQDAAVEANKRADEIKQKDNFYKIVLSEDEIDELRELNKAIKKLRNPLPFRKAVYDIYYKPKVSELVLRVVGSGRRTGIYKITHIESQKVYVGQSVDIGNRWKQHAKRGCGADQITQNKLYPAMLEEGIESFTWEIIEEVESDKLSEAEKYWQEFYKAKEFGYSMK